MKKIYFVVFLYCLFMASSVFAAPESGGNKSAQQTADAWGFDESALLSKKGPWFESEEGMKEYARTTGGTAEQGNMLYLKIMGLMVAGAAIGFWLRRKMNE